MLNKARRKLAEQMEHHVNSADMAVSELLEDLRELYDSRSESWQESEKGVALESYISELDDLQTALGYFPCQSSLEV